MKAASIALSSLVAGALLGYAAHHLTRPTATQTTGEVAFSSLRSELAPPPLSQRESDALQAKHYAAVQTVTEALGFGSSFTRTEALYALAGRADTDTLRHLIGQAASLDKPADQRDALAVLFQRFGELDPQGAIQHLNTLNLRFEAALAAGIFRAWAEVDLPAAMAAIHNIGDPIAQSRAANAVIAAWRTRDPGLALRIIKQMPDGFDASHALARHASEQALSDPVSALEEALSISQPNARGGAVRQIGTTWAQSDPVGALAYGQGIADSRARITFMQGVIGQWTAVDPDAAMRAIVEMQPGPWRDPLRRTGLNLIVARDPLRALEWGRTFDKNQPGITHYQQHVLRKLAGIDPRLAAAQLSGLHTEARTQVIGEIAASYARSDPADALAWVDGLTSGAERMRALPAVIQAVADHDPDAAMSFLTNMEASPARTQAINAAIVHISRFGNAADASRYFDLVPPGPARMGAASSIASNWALSDPFAALAWSQSLEGQLRDSAVSAAMNLWTQVDLPAAKAYALNHMDTANRAIISGFIGEFSRQNPVDAYDFLKQFEGTPLFEQNVMSTMMFWANSDPAAAMQQAATINGDGIRGMTISVVSREWAQRDPVAASQWAADMPAGPGQSDAVQSVMRHLASQDLQHAERWAYTLKSGGARDRAFLTLMHGTHEYSAANTDWVNEISNAETRIQAARWLVTLASGAGQDPDDLLLDLNLNAEQRFRILENVGRQEGR